MAKSARSSRTKANNQALKKKVFGPVETARNERMNAKLLELAKQPKEKMEVDSEQEQEVESASKESEPAKDINMDGTAISGRPQRSKREIKRLQDHARTQRVEKSKRKKPRNQVAFPSRKKSGKK